MKAEDARRMANLMMTADYGCSDCAGRLLDDASEVWPEHRQLFAEVFQAKFPNFTLKWQQPPGGNEGEESS